MTYQSVECHGGDYRLEAPMGEGGQGLVYKAESLAHGETVAVKIYRLRERDFAPARFEREIEILRSTRHPSIIRYRDDNFPDRATDSSVADGPTPTPGKQLALVMEWAPVTLKSLCSESPIAWDSLRVILVKILGALAHLHEKGVIHRDVCPDNILFVSEESIEDPKLSDLGIAWQEGLDITQGSTAPGRPRLQSPRLKPRDGKSQPGPRPADDLFALGVTAFEVATGYRTDEVENLDAEEREDLRTRWSALDGRARAGIVSMLHDQKRPKKGDEGAQAGALKSWLQAKEGSRIKVPRRFRNIQKKGQPTETHSERELRAIVELVEPKNGSRTRLAILATLASLAVAALILYVAYLRPLPPEVVDYLPQIVKNRESFIVKVKGGNPLDGGKGCVVEEGGKLRIEGSGRLLFDALGGIASYGKLQIVGEASVQRLSFEPKVPEDGWLGIQIDGPGAAASEITNAILQGGKGSYYQWESPRYSLSQVDYQPKPLMRLPPEQATAVQKSERLGGALVLSSVEDVTLSQVDFLNNTSERGGALCSHNAHGVKLSNCRFRRNRATRKRGNAPGGAIYVCASSRFEVQESLFEENVARDLSSCGGAIYCGVHSNVHLRSCQFRRNVSGYVGGAIFAFHEGLSADKKSRGFCEVMQCVFENNHGMPWHGKAQSGFGCDVYTNNGYDTRIAETKFRNSLARHPFSSFVAEGAPDNPSVVEMLDTQFSWPGRRAKFWGLAFPKEHDNFLGVDMNRITVEFTPPVVNMPVTKGRRAVETDREIDTVVLHFVSAMYWTTAEDGKFNSAFREQAKNRFPELRGLNDLEMAFHPRAVWCIFEAYAVSSHYLIGRDGTIYLFVNEKEIAHHAGVSSMPGRFDPGERSSCNEFSIGIELASLDPTSDDPRWKGIVAPSKEPGFDSADGPVPAYTWAQYCSLSWLLWDIAQRHPIKYVVGHDEIAPTRKRDPGPMFAWDNVRDEKTGARRKISLDFPIEESPVATAVEIYNELRKEDADGRRILDSVKERALARDRTVSEVAGELVRWAIENQREAETRRDSGGESR